VSERDAYEVSQRQHVRDGSWEPTAAHPPEGSQPEKWPCQVAKGTQCSSEMCEPPIPPPGPGQDREARPEAALPTFRRPRAGEGLARERRLEALTAEVIYATVCRYEGHEPRCNVYGCTRHDHPEVEKVRGLLRAALGKP
jgi:hypothetical protein